ncbi:DNA helicase, partial [Tanacetum coccineum]
GGENSHLCRDIFEGFIDMLDTPNALVQLFRTAREKLADTYVPNFKVRLYNVVGVREYEMPTGDMLGAIVYEPGPETDMDYDIIIEERSGHPQRVNKLHSSYMSLQFPLLFPYGEYGYSKDLKLLGGTGTSESDKRLTMKAYYAYFIHYRINRYNYLSRTGRLFQQYVVTAFWIYDAINRGDNDGFDCGARLILPQSFVGGPRYMYSHYLDAFAFCRVHGNPSFFITFTCNVKWLEITEYMAQFPLLTTTDRADIVDRVFEMKIQLFVKYLRDVQPFGKVVAVLYTVEFLKQGLSHFNTLVWVHEASRIHRDENIDAYVSAELPSINTDPEWHKIVSELMIHGLCGLACLEPAVQILSIHLQNMQRVVFRDRDRLDSVVVNAHSKKTTLTEWLYYNEWNTNGRHLTYLDFPSEFVWNPSGKYWRRRRQRHKSSIGRNPNDDVKMWDVGGDAFDSMEDVGFLEFADLSLDEPEFENDLIIDN